MSAPRPDAFLREIQSQGRDGARWFQGDELDVFVWQAADRSIESIQVTFQDGDRELALSWQRGQGSSFDLVDAGQEPGAYPRSPLLIPAPAVDLSRLLWKFERDSVHIDAAVRAFILDWLRQESGQQRADGI